MNCAIIGSTKIAQVHAEQLIKNGVREITFLSRSRIKREKIITEVKKKISKKILFFHSDLKILKKKSFNIICICSNTEVHDKHLKFVSGLKSTIIIEKPIISLLKFKKKYQFFLKDFYRRNKKVIVCYPYLYLAKSFKNLINNKKRPKKINFEFQTGGKAKFKKICINLMPHALSFFHIFLKKKFFGKVFKKNLPIVEKHKWEVTFTVNKIILSLIFKENFLKKTSLKLKVDDLLIARKTLKKNGNFINFLQNYRTKKRKIINNPMGDFYKEFFKNHKNPQYYRLNKSLTFNIMKKNEFFLN